MKQIDKVAIIIVNYNGVDDTIECIKSIRVSYESIRIIVVDNASAEKEIDVIQNRYRDVKCIGNKSNLGFAAGNNVGIKWAIENGYEYIMLLNNDTVIKPDMIDNLLENVDENSISVPKMLYYYDKDVIWYGGGEINKRTGNAKHISMNCKDYYSVNTRKCTFATGCCMMIPREIFEDIGILDESYFMYCEDTEFCIRLLLNNKNIVYVPSAVLWHKVSASTKGSDSDFCTYYLTRNRLNYIKKYKNFFCWTAYPFSIVSRVVRSFQDFIKGNKRYRFFNKALKDHLKGISGKVDII